MAVELKKTNPSCLNIDLIDLNSCLGSSLSSINKTFINLSSAEKQIFDYLNSITTNLNLFQTLSSQLFITASNIKNINNISKNPYSTIQTLSSKWENKKFSVYYPNLIEINNFYLNTLVCKNSALDWFNQNFPSNYFVKDQIVNIFISLTYVNSFDFVFSGGLLENCSPTKSSEKKSLTCNGCGGDNRYAGCNIDGQGCTNAYSRCRSGKTKQAATYACQGQIGETFVYDSLHDPVFYSVGNTGALSINYIMNFEDRFLSRVIKLELKNVDNLGILNWEFL
jgi:hypothetical protein